MVRSLSFQQPNGECKVQEYSSESHSVHPGLADRFSAPDFKLVTIRGISIGTARALLRAGVPHFAMY